MEYSWESTTAFFGRAQDCLRITSEFTVIVRTSIRGRVAKSLEEERCSMRSDQLHVSPDEEIYVDVNIRGMEHRFSPIHPPKIHVLTGSQEGKTL